MNATFLQPAAVFAAFIFVAIASKQIGAFFTRFRLPLISGFIFAGILAGPFVLGLIPRSATEQLGLVDQVSMAVIAFAVGSKLYLSDLRARLRSILSISLANALLIPVVVSGIILLLANRIPFFTGVPLQSQIAIALVMATVLATRAPAVAIAIITEMRAKGPFTQTVLGATMVTDVAVIALFALTSSAASAVLNELPLDLAFGSVLVAEMALTVIVGAATGLALRWIFAISTRRAVQIALTLTMGLGVFVLASWLAGWTDANMRYAVQMQPLLACLVASFYVTNYTAYRKDFLHMLDDVTPVIYVLFFTLVGAGLALDALASLWPIALALFVTRVAAVFIASFTGGMLAGDPMRYNRLSWMTFLTQAGVGLGLAKSLAADNPGWGDNAAAMIVSAIVISELAGPPLFKWAMSRVGEAHTPAPTPEYEGQRAAIIFGLESQSVALARALIGAGWSVRIAVQESAAEHAAAFAGGGEPSVQIVGYDAITQAALLMLGADTADTIIAMLNDEDNYAICELAYERFGTEHIIVRLNRHRNAARFEKLGAIVLDPSTAVVSLLAHFVRAPAATSLLLGERTGQDVVDVHMRNRALDGVALRELRLPLDVLVLSVTRNGDALVSHGYTRLRQGDVVTVLGSSDSLEQVTLHFSE